MASSVFAGRYVARSNDEFVLFRIGMRFNGLRGIVPALQTFFTKMPGMLAEQHADPEIGMLSSSVAFSWPVVELTQIWRSFEDLERYATAPQGRHTSAWRWFNRLGRRGEGTGVWHETYRIAPKSFEAVYINMPRYGLAAAIDHVAVPAGATRNSAPRSSVVPEDMATTEKAILAGGCFWGVQDLLRSYPGILKTRVGYSGGDVPHATYRNHGTHAEAVEILFDPDKLSYRSLLEFFFQIHDPSTPNRQGNDRGPSYRSAIFYTSEEQRQIAEDTIADVDASHLWPGKVVTEVAPAGDFWEAEPEHQDYLVHNPGGYTCHFVRPDWKLPERSAAR